MTKKPKGYNIEAFNIALTNAYFEHFPSTSSFKYKRDKAILIKIEKKIFEIQEISKEIKYAKKSWD